MIRRRIELNRLEIVQMKKKSIASSGQILCGLFLLFFVTSVSAQICNSAVKRTAPSSHFSNNLDGTVDDLKTGLMWQHCSVGLGGGDCAVGSASVFTWDQALHQVEILNNNGGFAGYSDWRLPNIRELESLVEIGCHDPAINITVFPNTPASPSWTSTPYPGPITTHLVGAISFETGYYGGYSRDFPFGGLIVRLVRN